MCSRLLGGSMRGLFAASVILLVFLAMAGTALAEPREILSTLEPRGPEPAFPLSIGTFDGLWYNARPLSGTILDFLLIIFNFRAGFNLDMQYHLGAIEGKRGWLGIGAELGLAYMVSGEGETALHLVDLPTRVKFSLSAGKHLRLEGFAGLLSALAFTMHSQDYIPYVDLGGRLILGRFFMEAGYEIGLSAAAVSYPRFGMGAYLPVEQLFEEYLRK